MRRPRYDDLLAMVKTADDEGFARRPTTEELHAMIVALASLTDCIETTIDERSDSERAKVRTRT